MEIRYLTADDDRMVLSKIYEESWKYAYQGIVPQHYLDSIPEGRWASIADNPMWKTLICMDDGKMVGTSSFCRSRFEQFYGWGEIISLYLLPAYMGKGYGQTLMESVVSELKKQGYERVFLWVLEENIRARHFYERFGFSPADEYIEDNICGKDLREVRYIYSVR